MQTFVHYFLHFAFPGILVFLFYRKNWKQAYLILLATMLVDLDHLLADPIFASNRCSVGFHYLHQIYVMPVYVVLLFFWKPWHWLGLGLCLHMLTDFIDCWFMFRRCASCLEGAPAYEALEWVNGLF